MKTENYMKDKCKICNSLLNEFVDHTAKCSICGVLLYFPYPNKNQLESVFLNEEQNYEWYANSFTRKLNGFRDIITFVIEGTEQKEYRVLDYGGASGQFALIFKTFFPKSEVFITDINDNSLFEEYKSLNNQIKFNEFENDQTKFDIIFLNDVYEHVEDPLYLISVLEKKLNKNGKIFIDTPRQFWIYPLFRKINSYIYKKILRGTVSAAHLQIWTNYSFELSLKNTDLKIFKKKYYTELTQDPDYYIRGMNINNKIIKSILVFLAGLMLFTFRNKIFAVLKK
tara:strand:- start:255 stop:1103 length:849 start_codon:yes stop_codon:yes gene_type:complete